MKKVLIVGGGPGGVATALQLVARGVEVVVMEAGMEVWRKPGETLPPQARRVFQQLKLGHVLEEEAHMVCYGNRAVWGSEQVVDKLFYYYTGAEGWHVDRRVFEGRLMEEVRRRGGVVMSGCRVKGVSCIGDRWRVRYGEEVDGDGRMAGIERRSLDKVIDCDFIVDATGRKARIARSLGIERRNLDKLTGQYMVVPYSGKLQQYTYIEAVENGWWYMAPLKSQQLVLTYMTDADLISDTCEALFLQTRFLRGLVDIDVFVPKIYSAATGYLKQRHGGNWLAVGDAAFAYDPISSHGIISALEGGYYAGHAIAEHLGGNEDALNAYDYAISQAFSVYMEMHAGYYGLERRWQESLFWMRRGGDRVGVGVFGNRGRGYG